MPGFKNSFVLALVLLTVIPTFAGNMDGKCLYKGRTKVFVEVYRSVVYPGAEPVLVCTEDFVFLTSESYESENDASVAAYSDLAFSREKAIAKASEKYPNDIDGVGYTFKVSLTEIDTLKNCPFPGLETKNIKEGDCQYAGSVTITVKTWGTAVYPGAKEKLYAEKQYAFEADQLYESEELAHKNCQLKMNEFKEKAQDQAKEDNPSHSLIGVKYRYEVSEAKISIKKLFADKTKAINSGFVCYFVGQATATAMPAFPPVQIPENPVTIDPVKVTEFTGKYYDRNKASKYAQELVPKAEQKARKQAAMAWNVSEEKIIVTSNVEVIRTCLTGYIE